MLSLTPEEQKWLDDYRRILDEKYGDIVEDIIIYGSKARGDANEDSDVDVLLIVNQHSYEIKRKLIDPAIDLSVCTPVVPSIIVCSIERWKKWESYKYTIWENIKRDGISVYEKARNYSLL